MVQRPELIHLLSVTGVSDARNSVVQREHLPEQVHLLAITGVIKNETVRFTETVSAQKVSIRRSNATKTRLFCISGRRFFCTDYGGRRFGARPVHLIITMIKWIRSSRLSIENSLLARG